MTITLPVSHFNMTLKTNMLLSQFAGLRGFVGVVRKEIENEVYVTVTLPVGHIQYDFTD